MAIYFPNPNHWYEYIGICHA